MRLVAALKSHDSGHLQSRIGAEATMQRKDSGVTLIYCNTTETTLSETSAAITGVLVVGVSIHPTLACYYLTGCALLHRPLFGAAFAQRPHLTSVLPSHRSREPRPHLPLGVDRFRMDGRKHPPSLPPNHSIIDLVGHSPAAAVHLGDAESEGDLVKVRPMWGAAVKNRNREMCGEAWAVFRQSMEGEVSRLRVEELLLP